MLAAAALAGLLILACGPTQKPSANEPPRPSHADAPHPPAARERQPGTSWPRFAREIFGFPLPVERIERHHPQFPDTDPGSIAVGTVTTGYLVRAAKLPLDGPHHRVLRVQRERGTNYGTDELVGVIQRAAASVAKKFPGSLLYVGNLARDGGGDIIWSFSHNNGRDADISFYLLGPDGKPYEPRELYLLDRDGHSISFEGKLRFDVPRNWELVKALVSDRAVRIQFIFVASYLKSMLLKYASKKREPRSVIALAERILKQPGGALPHNDHFHLRLYCSKRDRLEGCLELGPKHEDDEAWGELARRRAKRIRRFLTSKQVSRRRDAVEMLRLLDDRDSAGAIARLLRDPSPLVRISAIRTLGAFQSHELLPALIALLQKERDPLALESAMAALRRFRQKETVAFLRKCLLDVTRQLGGRPLAARCAEHLGALDELASVALPELIAALAASDAAVRDAARTALERITNHDGETIGPPKKTPTTDPAQKTATKGPAQKTATIIERWRGWLAKHRRQPRSRWVLDGFRRSRYELSKKLRRSIPDLIRAVGDKDHLSYNAQRLLMRITNHRPRSLEWSRFDAQYYWDRWYNKRRRRFQ